MTRAHSDLLRYSLLRLGPTDVIWLCPRSTFRPARSSASKIGPGSLMALWVEMSERSLDALSPGFCASCTVSSPLRIGTYCARSAAVRRDVLRLHRASRTADSVTLWLN